MSIDNEKKNNLELYGTTSDYGSNSDYMQEMSVWNCNMKYKGQKVLGSR